MTPLQPQRTISSFPASHHLEIRSLSKLLSTPAALFVRPSFPVFFTAASDPDPGGAELIAASVAVEVGCTTSKSNKPKQSEGSSSLSIQAFLLLSSAEADWVELFLGEGMEVEESGRAIKKVAVREERDWMSEGGVISGNLELGLGMTVLRVGTQSMIGCGKGVKD